MELLKQGKVRDIFFSKSFQDHLIIYHSDRLSSFDSNICDIEGKGNLLMLLSIWWLENTKNIIDNHYVSHYRNYMLIKKCEVIPLEFIVRGYITGSTNTSLWTHYNNGSRNYCGVDFPDGLLKNQKLECPVLTPTTKSDEHDELISCEEILKRKILFKDQLDFIKQKALELFRFGQEVADKNGLILVDTKYEFGIDVNKNIILIDEIHTGDSSRYWRKETYTNLFNEGKEPQKIDKDAVRDYIRSVCDPYKDKIPSPEEIPQTVKNNVVSGYKFLYENISGNTYTNQILGNLIEHSHVNMLLNSLVRRHIVIILAGSVRDSDHINKISSHLDKFNILHETCVCSAHKNTSELLQLMKGYNSLKNIKIVFITIAGRSNALSGVVACNTEYPVLACPPFKDKIDMFININSTLQCPSNTPVLAVLEPENVAISCKRILSL